MSFIDRAVAWISPERAFKRAQYRKAFEALAYYEAGGKTNRTSHFRRNTSDANAAFRGQLGDIRNISRDLVRNNSYAARGIEAITNNTVGTGIVAKITGRNERETKKLKELWAAHAETSQVDADGKRDIYGLQSLALRTVAQSGECLIRKRARLLRDGFALPFRMQVLEPDYIDGSKDGVSDIQGNTIVQGVEYNKVGRKVFFWLFDQHPGNSKGYAGTSSRVSADNIAHVFRMDRPGQARGVPWLAPAILRLQDLKDYESAQLMRQKIAACFAVIVTGVDVAEDLTQTDPEKYPGLTETVRPGTIQYAPPGRSVVFPDPPQVGDYGVITEQSLRAVAVSLGITYECLTGNLSQVNFSSGRMGWLEMYRNIEVWRWHLLIPDFCQVYARWFTEGAMIAAGVGIDAIFDWTPPRREMIDPTSEVPAIIKSIRGGLTSLPSVHREYGEDTVKIIAEIIESNKMLDDGGLILDSDPRRVSQVGQEQQQGGQASGRAQ